jgi:adenylate cyclase
MCIRDSQGLVLAEIELQNENESFGLPGWAGEEVSHDTRYYNSRLSKNPYSKW